MPIGRLAERHPEVYADGCIFLVRLSYLVLGYLHRGPPAMLFLGDQRQPEQSRFSQSPRQVRHLPLSGVLQVRQLSPLHFRVSSVQSKDKINSLDVVVPTSAEAEVTGKRYATWLIGFGCVA